LFRLYDLYTYIFKSFPLVYVHILIFFLGVITYSNVCFPFLYLCYISCDIYLYFCVKLLRIRTNPYIIKNPSQSRAPPTESSPLRAERRPRNLSVHLGTGGDKTRERRSTANKRHFGATKQHCCGSGWLLAKVSQGERRREIPGEYFSIPAREISHYEPVQINQPNRPHQIPIHSIYVPPPTVHCKNRVNLFRGASSICLK
jgi:hypothetical protein